MLGGGAPGCGHDPDKAPGPWVDGDCAVCTQAKYRKK